MSVQLLNNTALLLKPGHSLVPISFLFIRKDIILQALTILMMLFSLHALPVYAQRQAHKNDPLFNYINTFQRKPFDGQIVTDRPSFSIGPGTIPKGRVQFETGYTFTLNRTSADTITTHTFPENLVRIGLTDISEFRIEWPTHTFINGREEQDGLKDMAIGFKTQIFQQQGLRPQLSFAGRLLIPTGGKHLSSRHIDPEFQAILNFIINKRFSLLSNLNIGSNTVQGNRVTQFASSLGLSINIHNTLSGFIEYYGIYPIGNDMIDTHYFQAGLIHQFSYHLQLDARVGTGISAHTEDVLAGAGISWRF